MKKIVFILFLLFTTGNMNVAMAQSWLERLGKRAEEAAKRKIERKIEEKVDKAVDKAVDSAFDKNEQRAQETQQKKQDKTPIVEPADTGTPAPDTRDWDDNEPYYALKKGSKITYTVYNGKGKVQGYNISEILEITRKKNSVNATVMGTHTNAKGKVESSATASLRYSNGNFHAALLDMMPLEGLENAKIDAEMTGKDMLIPSQLTPGQVLPEAQASFNMKMGDGNNTMDLPQIDFLIYNRRAVRAEVVETPVGKFVCFKIIQTVSADYPLIGTKRATCITWMGKGVGVVKSESYDAKGKLTSRTLLTGIE